MAGERLAGQMAAQHFGAEIGAVRPDDCADFGIDADLGKEVRIAQRREDPGEVQQRCEVYFARGAIVEAHKEAITRDAPHLDDVVQHAGGSGKVSAAPSNLLRLACSSGSLSWMRRQTVS